MRYRNWGKSIPPDQLSDYFHATRESSRRNKRKASALKASKAAAKKRTANAKKKKLAKKSRPE